MNEIAKKEIEKSIEIIKKEVDKCYDLISKEYNIIEIMQNENLKEICDHLNSINHWNKRIEQKL